MFSNDVKQELRRKVVHGGLTGTIAPVLTIVIKGVTLLRILALCLYSAFLTLFVLQEYSLKKGKQWNIPFASKAYEIMANSYEIENRTLLGGIFIIVSGMLLYSLLNVYAALVAVMILSYADSAASIFGKAYPHHPIAYNKSKHLEGSIAFIATSLIVTAFSLNLASITYSKILIYSFTISVASALVESLPTKYYYDNLTVPLSAGLLAQILMKM